MKKTFLLLLITVLLFAFVACDGNPSVNEPSGSGSVENGAFSIGSEKFKTLQDAVDSLATKSAPKDFSVEYTIKLNADVVDKGAVISGISVGFKIDFGTHVYTLANSSFGITIESNNAGVEISGGIIALGSGNSFSSVITAKGDVTINGLSMDVSSHDVDAVTATSGTLKLSGSTSIKTNGDMNAIAVSGSAKVSTTSSEVVISGGIELSDTATLDLQAGVIEVAVVKLNGDSVTVKISEVVTVKPASEENQEDLDNLDNHAVHTHAYSEDWSSDENYHWHEPLSQDNPLKGNYEEHKWDRGDVTKAASCTTPGEIEYKCTECGTTKTVEIETGAHNYSLVESVEATCLENGYLRYRCSLCNEEKQVVVLALGHDFGSDNTCDRCGYTVEPTHEHSFSEQVHAPSCIEMGYTVHQCSGCEYSYKDNFIEPTGHKFDGGTVSVAKTCITDGELTYHCQYCEETMTEAIPKGHEYSYTILTPATCTESGLRIAVCDICEHRIEDDVIPASHSWNEGEVIEEASCTSEGLVRYKCSVCGETENVVVPVTGHEYKNGVCIHCDHHYIDDIYSDKDFPEYGMYFHIEDIVSAYGPNLINTYGVLLDFNDGAEIEKVGVYLTQDGTMWRRSLAFTGTGVTRAYYVPFLAYDSDIYYTGMNSNRINTFPLSKNTSGIYTYGNYTTIGVNLADKYGRLLLSLYDVGQAGAKTRIFDNLNEMIAWLNEGSTVCTHNYGDWVVTKEATCSETGTKTRTCSICQDVQTELIPINSDNHSYSSEWTSDSTYHWHAVTCGHDVIPEKTEHIFGANAVCTVCGRLSDDAVTVSFDANGGDGSMAGITVLSGSKITIIESGFTAPTGMTFAGWNTASDGTGESFKSGDEFTVTSNTTLYAQWKEYNANDTPLTLEFIESGTLSFSNPRNSLRYSKNGGPKTAVSGSIVVAAGDVISLYADAVNQTQLNYLKINGTSDCYVYGNVMSLLDSENYATDVDISVSHALYRLFKDNTHIKNHPTNKLVLPATLLADSCYAQMFYGCTGLTAAPELPATTLAGYCYSDMFSGCTGLTAAPKLPATTLAGYCYAEMFSGCTGLTAAPELPAATLVGYCYSDMFSGCTGLTTAPELPATTLGDGCYKYMFSGCTGLKTAPELPATTLGIGCYASMFSGCTGLTAAPELPAMTLVNSCYAAMFYGCTGLTSAPELPVTTLADECYQSMFYGCTGLTEAPELPATTLAYYCYSYMFNGCENLSSITCLATDISAKDCTYNWLYGVASNGTFTKASTMNGWGTGASGIPSGWTVVNSDKTPLTLEFIESGTLSFTNPRSSLQYSKNGGVRTTVSGSIAVAAGDVISLYAEAATQTSSSYLNINCTSDCYVYGNVMSLLDSENYATAVDISVNYALYGLFWNNTHIKNHPTNKLVLPATTLADYCYRYMFYGCTGLTTAPELPATTLAYACYSGMFDSCTGLTAAPELPATTLASSCYHDMFRGCTGLTVAPALPATSLAGGCYASMFSGCTGLTAAPELPATTLSYFCYGSMFYGCTGLTAAPVLPAKTLVDSCYSAMFRGCTSLTEAPELPATTLARDCYNSMFYDCTNLSSITCLATNISAVNCTYNWLSGVASNGTFTKASTMNGWGTGSSRIPSGWTVVNKDTPLTLEFIESGTLSFTNPRSSLQYSKNGGARTAVSGSIAVAAGDVISLYAEAINQTEWNYLNIKCTSDCYVYGNVMSLLDSENYANDVDISVSYALRGLFRDNTHIKNHPTKKLVLPATTLANYCYEYMFYGCTGLTEAPELPATTLASHCYASMFRGCTGLTAAPELPATTLAESCYRYMFDGCTGLTVAPELPATTLAYYCYGSMFYGCTGLTSAPALPATTLASGCYDHMFYGCTGLTSAPALPATTLASSCYDHMFYGCTGLTAAPELPAKTLAVGCYDSMFGCTGLTAAPELPATTLASRCYEYMFYGCTGLTSAPALPATTLASYCYAYMFDGCTGLTAAPELPAKTLASGCYDSMFYGCTGLTAAPELPATTLASRCYEYMFYGCTNLSSITCLATNISASYCTYNWLSGVASNGTFTKASTMNGWGTGSSRIPSGWTVVNK